MFDHDAEGKPIAKFVIETEQGLRKWIKRPEHSLYVFPRVKELDKKIDGLYISFGRTSRDWRDEWKELTALERELANLIAEAIFLDTADRNSWSSIKSLYAPEKVTNFYGVQTMREFWGGHYEELFK